MSSIESHDIDTDSSDPFKTSCALLVSTLAMTLAIASLGGSNAAKDATAENILASNAYAFYQAKNIRQTSYKIAADNIDFQLANDKLNAEQKAKLEKALAGYKKNIERYESEPDTGEGKKELMVTAKKHEAHRDHAMKQDPWFDYAEALLQISIVLTSVAIITNRRTFFKVSLVLGTLGLLSTLNGFLLMV
ncbi:MAG: DUF4337 domain-containing protein [Betaproteobacteria bacterium]